MLRTSMTAGASLLLIASLLVAIPAAAQEDDGTLPATVYEDPAIPPQAMDYDDQTQTFPNHPGWYQDKKIHYYKFQMYTPGSYPGQFGPEADNQVPVVPLYLVTSTDDPTTATNPFDGIPEDQHPIIKEFPTKDNTDYSDFVRVHWVVVGSDYEANDYDSYDDVANHSTVIESNIVANVPIVPVGSTLEHPTASGDAPIEGLTVWYEGLEAQAFVFETDDQAFADHFNPITRQGPAADAGSGFEIVVNGDFVTTTGDIAAMPIWHVNQYWTDVETGVNHGGPSPNGQQNTISVDRLDDGYSPLWQVFWVHQVPPGYQADQASHHSQFTSDNGFEIFQSPMFVNCPNIGPHGGADLNSDKADGFDASPTVSPGEKIRLQGALVMPGAKTPVDVQLNGQDHTTATSVPMGGFHFTVDGADLEPGENTVTATADVDGPVTEFSWTLQGASADDGADGSTDDGRDGDGGSDETTNGSPAPAALIVVGLLAGAAAAFRRV